MFFKYCWLFFIVLLSFYLYCLVTKRVKAKKSHNAIIIVLTVLVLAFRPDTTKDFEVYLEIYNRSPSLILESGYPSVLSNISSVEAGFVYLCSFFRTLHFDFRLFTLLCSLFSVVSVPYCLNKLSANPKNPNNLLIIRCLYVCSYSLLYCGIAIRAGLAIALCLLGIAIFRKKTILFSLVLFFAAFIIQRTSILFFLILLLIILFRKYSVLRKRYLAVFVCTFAFLALIVSLRYFLPTFNSAVNRLLGFISTRNYYDSYLLQSSDQLIGLTTILVVFVSIFSVFATCVYRSKLYVYQVVLMLLVAFLAIMLSGFRASSRIYDT